jgi:alpha-beta hydrolase superfamily lysophospholipase
MFVKTQDKFRSFDKENDIVYYVWTPNDPPKGILHIVHGMSEYSDRYEDFAQFLCSKGYVVCADDHLGHGRTAKTDKDLGYITPKKGDVCLVKDEISLVEIMRKKYRHLPYIIFGHSMGSFITRVLVATHPDAVDGVILSGTSGSKPPFGFGKKVASLLCTFTGKKRRSKLIFAIAFSSYNKTFVEKGQKAQGYEWLSPVPDKLAAFANDKLCGFRFTNGGYKAMFALGQYMSSEKWYEDYPKGMPTLLVAGAEDPVGQYGDGVLEVYTKLKEANMSDIEAKLYKGERHELLFGDKTELFLKDVEAWLERVTSSIVEARTQNRAQFER